MEDILLPDFRAQFTFFEEKDGGRKIPTGDGYRAELHFSDVAFVGHGSFEFTDQELVYAGDVLEGTIGLVDKDEYMGKLYAGADFEFYEGEQQVGTGVILSVLNADLK